MTDFDPLPCPFCGASHKRGDVRFYDECGDEFGDLSMIHDFEDVRNPSNAAWPETWERMSEEERAQVSKTYLECIEGVEFVTLHCSNCGGSYSADATKLGFPYHGWFANFLDDADCRAITMVEMIATLDMYAFATEGKVHDDLVKAKDAVIQARDVWRNMAVRRMSE